MPLLKIFNLPLSLIHRYNQYNKQYYYKQQMSKIRYNSYNGTTMFKWPRSHFSQISQALCLRTNTESRSSVRSYTRTYPPPFQCKVIFYESGRVIITSARSLEAMQEILGFLISELMEKLPDIDIAVVEDLTVTNCYARVGLEGVDIGRLREAINKVFGSDGRGSTQYRYKANIVYLPYQIHKIQKVSILITTNQAKITKAHYVANHQLLSKYLNFILHPFKKQSNQREKQKYVYSHMQQGDDEEESQDNNRFKRLKRSRNHNKNDYLYGEGEDDLESNRNIDGKYNLQQIEQLDYKKFMVQDQRNFQNGIEQYPIQNEQQQQNDQGQIKKDIKNTKKTKASQNQKKTQLKKIQKQWKKMIKKHLNISKNPKNQEGSKRKQSKYQIPQSQPINKKRVRDKFKKKNINKEDNEYNQQFKQEGQCQQLHPQAQSNFFQPANIFFQEEVFQQQKQHN